MSGLINIKLVISPAFCDYSILKYIRLFMCVSVCLSTKSLTHTIYDISKSSKIS